MPVCADVVVLVLFGIGCMVEDWVGGLHPVSVATHIASDMPGAGHTFPDVFNRIQLSSMWRPAAQMIL